MSLLRRVGGHLPLLLDVGVVQGSCRTPLQPYVSWVVHVLRNDACVIVKSSQRRRLTWSHGAATPRISHRVRRRRGFRAFVEDREYASDLVRRHAWERCVALRAAQARRLSAVKVRAAGRGRQSHK